MCGSPEWACPSEPLISETCRWAGDFDLVCPIRSGAVCIMLAKHQSVLVLRSSTVLSSFATITVPLMSEPQVPPFEHAVAARLRQLCRQLGTSLPKGMLCAAWPRDDKHCIVICAKVQAGLCFLDMH